MDDDDTDAAWAEQELQERHRREDELIKRCRPLQAELRRMIDETKTRQDLRKSLCRK